MSYASTNFAVQLGILQMGIGCAMNACKKQSTINNIEYRLPQSLYGLGQIQRCIEGSAKMTASAWLNELVRARLITGKIKGIMQRYINTLMFHTVALSLLCDQVQAT